MWGFLSGTLALIILQTLVQPGASTKAAGGIGALNNALQKLISPGVPGIAQTKKAKTAATAAATANKAGDGSASINPATGLPNAFNNIVIPPPGGPAGSPGAGSGSGPGT